jgi:hypothetical protein
MGLRAGLDGRKNHRHVPNRNEKLFLQPKGCSIRYTNSESLQTPPTQGKAIHPDVSPCYHRHDTINGYVEYTCNDQSLHMIKNINDMKLYILFSPRYGWYNTFHNPRSPNYVNTARMCSYIN